MNEIEPVIVDLSSEEVLAALFGICNSKEELQEHIKTFLNIDLPNTTLDEDSTSNPMQFVWDCYNYMRTGKGPSRHVAAASRNSYKTVSTAILQFYILNHFRRDSIQISAEIQQSLSAIAYVDGFFRLKELAIYSDTDNARKKIISGLPANELTSKKIATLKVVTATKKGLNSSRGSCIIYDECDLISRESLGESAFIADPERFTGFGALSIYISSRKANDGPIQDLIDEYDSDKPEDLMLHKWSIVDIMKYCPPEVYKEDKPIKAYMHLETLEIHWGEERFDAIVKEGKTAWKEIQSYEGCRTCPAFIACQSRAMRQTADKPTLRDRFFVGDVLKKVIKTGGPSMIIAQSLNMKPDTSSLVFNMFKTTRNVSQAIDFFKWVAGYYYAPSQIYTPDMIEEIIDGGDPIQIASITPTKADMYAAMRRTGWTFNAGVDWGLYDPAVCLIAGYHKASKRVAFLHTEASSGYANEDWAKYIKANIHNQFPVDLVCPDFGDPNSAIYFGRLQMVCRDKKPARIETGVAQLRSLMFNPFTQQSHLMILDDGEYGQNSMLIESLQKWTYLKNASGYNFNKFADDEFTHTIDSARYLLDPFIADFNIGYSFNQKVNLSGNLPMQVALGDEETREAAKAAIKETNRVHNLILNELQSKHGVVGDPFARTPGTQNPQAGGKSGIKFRF